MTKQCVLDYMDRVLTGRVVIDWNRILIAAVVVAKHCFEVAVLIPVKRLDFEATTFRVSTYYSWHSLVHLTGRPSGILGQEEDLIAQVTPAPHAGQLRKEFIEF